jgi:hypothetical protein
MRSITSLTQESIVALLARQNISGIISNDGIVEFVAYPVEWVVLRWWRTRKLRIFVESQVLQVFS